MPTKKKRTLAEYRQTKDSMYTPPVSHKINNETKFTFSKKGLVKLLEDFRNVDELPEDFVNTIIP
tara:strand:- start:142 stop:336 length:195 start_codon:yes stop_codon:yes gene_type:complete